MGTRVLGKYDISGVWEMNESTRRHCGSGAFPMGTDGEACSFRRECFSLCADMQVKLEDSCVLCDTGCVGDGRTGGGTDQCGG